MDITTLAAWGEFLGGIAALSGISDPSEFAVPSKLYHSCVEPGRGRNRHLDGAGTRRRTVVQGRPYQS
jgi:hypothetical protein